jgi:hypothetical protein
MVGAPGAAAARRRLGTEVAEWEEPRHSGPCWRNTTPLHPTLQHISPHDSPEARSDAPSPHGCRQSAWPPNLPRKAGAASAYSHLLGLGGISRAIAAPGGGPHPAKTPAAPSAPRPRASAREGPVRTEASNGPACPITRRWSRTALNRPKGILIRRSRATPASSRVAVALDGSGGAAKTASATWKSSCHARHPRWPTCWMIAATSGVWRVMGHNVPQGARLPRTQTPRAPISLRRPPPRRRCRAAR